MKQIALTQGMFASVDNKYFDWLNQYKWYAHKNTNTYYAYRNKNYKTIAMHRMILGLAHGDKRKTDHRDHNGLNNQECNLRICTDSQNQHNRRVSWGKSKYKGVAWNKSSKKWQAQIKYNNQEYYLGVYTTQEEAAKAYDIKAKKLFGNYAYLNLIN